MTNYERIIEAMNKLHDTKAAKVFQRFMHCDYCPVWEQCHEKVLKDGVDICCERPEELDGDRIKEYFAIMKIEDMACMITETNEKMGNPNTGDYMYDETIFNFLKKKDKTGLEKIFKFYKF